MIFNKIFLVCCYQSATFASDVRVMAPQRCDHERNISGVAISHKADERNLVRFFVYHKNVIGMR